MSRTRLSASDLRSQAWTAMTNTWPTILGISFVINLISLIAGEITGMLAYPFGAILSFVVSLVLTVPRLGLVRGAMDYLRRGIFTFDHIKSVFPYTREMICYSLWESLFIFLWMLPGVLLFSIGDIVTLSATSRSTALIGMIMFFAGLLLIFVLMFYTLLNYALSQCCIVDNPHMGGREALAKSKRLMRGHRWLYIRMGIPVFLMSVIITAIAVALVGKVNLTLLTLITSILSIAPQVVAMYLAPVLYEELCYTA